MTLLAKNIAYLQSQLTDWSEAELQRLQSNEAVHPQTLVDVANAVGETVDRLLTVDLQERHQRPSDLKLIVFDVDGVLTDAGMYYTESGDEFKRFNARDGLAMKALVKAGYQTGIISHGINENLIRRRAALLDVTKVYCGTQPKNEVLALWCTEMGIALHQCAFIGDDVNDLPILRVVGFSACPSDAADAVKQECDVVLKQKGGDGCVREWSDRFLLEQPLGTF